ncbi:MAG: carbon starvation CstA family protein [Myxococcota bacterium]
MGGAYIIVFSIIIFIAGYKFYGSFIAKRLGVDPQRPTPAHTNYDGVDYVPTRPSILIGHHFSSIAGAAPIIGPVVAARYGWTAVLAWIVIGGIFMGAVHDFASLLISVRHQGRSLGMVVEQRIGKTAKNLFLIFVYATLLLVIAVFTNAVANVFHKFPQAGTASILFIILAIGIGFSLYRLKVNFILITMAGLIFLGFSVYLGYLYPLVLSVNTWKIIMLLYILAASVMPVWLLLQPRDYLNSYILYLMLFILVTGIIVVNPKLQLGTKPVFFTDKGPLLPLLFVTVACGALSGFHSLVAAGTTSKQLDSEKDAVKVGYGSMLIESLLAVTALITAAVMTTGDYSQATGDPIGVFSKNSATILNGIGIPVFVGTTFMALAVAAFALTSLDTATRLGRFAFQELFLDPEKSTSEQSFLANNRYFATIITVVLGGGLVFSGTATDIWPIFGAANQLLASLAFLVITVWLVHLKRPKRFAIIPGVFIYSVTMAALVYNIYDFAGSGKYALAILSLILMILALVLGYEGVGVLLGKKTILNK